MPGPGIGLRMQAVVDVQRAQAARAGRAVLRKQVQQHAGIQTAAEGDKHRRVGRGAGGQDDHGRPALQAAS